MNIVNCSNYQTKSDNIPAAIPLNANTFAAGSKNALGQQEVPTLKPLDRIFLLKKMTKY